MHPAPSIIVFTAISGLGFGLLAWLGVGVPDVTGWSAFAFFFIAYALAAGGLMASAFHLGHPERAFKAFSQWRSSWLSREAVLSVATLLAFGPYALALWLFETRLGLLGAVGSLLALATVFSTSMIYASLRAVPRWNHWLVPTLFLLYAISGGALLSGEIYAAALLFLVLAGAQLLYWRTGDKLFHAAGSTAETATGLGFMGKVRQLEPPHTGPNYLLKEMVFVVGRRRAERLRLIALLSGAILPALVLSIVPAGHLAAAVAVLLHVIGLLAARWLFFAEAEHVVGLYYGRR